MDMATGMILSLIINVIWSHRTFPVNTYKGIMFHNASCVLLITTVASVLKISR